MAASAPVFFGAGLKSLLTEAEAQWDGAGDIAAAIVKATYTPDQGDHETWAEVSTYESDGTNDDPIDVAGAAVQRAVSSAVKTNIRSNDLDWGTNVTIANAVRYVVTMFGTYDTPPLSTSVLIFLINLGADITITGEVFKLTQHADGWIDFDNP